MNDKELVAKLNILATKPTPGGDLLGAAARRIEELNETVELLQRDLNESEGEVHMLSKFGPEEE